MAYAVELERSFRAVQGLPSPVRARRGDPPVDGFEVVLRAGVTFGEEQLTGRGWFFDTDAADEVLDELSARLAQLSYVELANRTMGVTTRYAG